MVERGVAVVVEDDDDIRTTLTEVLQQSGFAVHSTSSGVAGVDAVRAHNPDIVTMDVGLPDFDGIEASRQASINGEPVDLTRTQFDILLVLMENGRTVQTKADLVRRLRNEPYNTGSFVTAGEERAVEVHVGNLRKRLGDSSQKPRWVETVRGVGYRMTP